MIKYIFHISDIHIIDRSFTNILHSFEILIDDIKNKGVDNSLLVIVGDIFEHKCTLYSEEIEIFYRLCSLIDENDVKTLIIPGNHDININNDKIIDNITLLLGQRKSTNIKVFNETKIISNSQEYGNIDFYIYSPIDKKLLEINDNDKIKVGIMHETINGSVFDNNRKVNNDKYNINIFKGLDIVLLGDIHKPQFLTENIAYSGSFVQKNKGEGIDHGYILWDMETLKGEHIFIPLEELFITIDAENDKYCDIDIKENQKIKHISFRYNNCSEKFIENTKKEIIEKYGSINKTIGKIIKKENVKKENKKINHDKSIVKILDKNNLIHYKDRVLNYHGKKLQDIREINYSCYKLNYMKWSNIFCYGPDNCIDFSNFENEFIILNGKNKEGKSTIIDMIIICLFNENIRGKKTDIVNKKFKTGDIEISFNIGKDNYIIQRHFIKNRTKGTEKSHKLLKNDEDITKDTLTNTYKFIKKDLGLGDHKDFMNMSGAIQNRNFIVDLNSSQNKDFISFLGKMTNIDALKEIEDLTKKETSVIRTKNKQLENLSRSIGSIDISDIEDLEKKIKKNKEKKKLLSHEKEKINLELNEIWKDYKEVSNCPENIDEIIDELRMDVDGFIPEKYIGEEIKEKSLILSYKINEIKGEEIKNDEELEVLFGKWKKNTDKPPKEDKGDLTNEQVEEVINIGSDYNYFSLKECDIKKVKKIEWKEEWGKGVEYYESLVDSIYVDENLIEVKKEPKKNKDLEDYDKIESIVLGWENNMKIIKKLKYSPECSCCKSNKKIVKDIKGKDIEKYKEILSTKEEDIKSWEKNKQERENWENWQRHLLKNKYLSIIEEINNYNYYSKQNEIFINNKNNEETNEKMKIRNEHWEKCLRIKKWNEWKYNDRIGRMVKWHYNTELKEYNNISSLLKKYKKLKDLENIKKDWEVIGDKNILIEKKKKSICIIEKEISIIEKKLEENNILLTTLENNRKLKEKYHMEINENTEELEFLNAYLSCINSKTGIPNEILTDICIILNDECNDFLVDINADFSVNIEFGEKLIINTVEDGLEIPAEMGSGYQKFVLDMILRVILMRVSDISHPGILFIDEGFGSLDSNNFIEVSTNIRKLIGEYSLFIITHMDELKSYGDKIINIERTNGLSFIR